MAAHARDSEINEFYGGRERGERAVFVFICQCLRRKRHSCRLACLCLSDGSSVSQSEGDHERGFPSSSPFPPPPSELAILFNCSLFMSPLSVCLSVCRYRPSFSASVKGKMEGICWHDGKWEAERAPSSRWYFQTHLMRPAAPIRINVMELL